MALPNDILKLQFTPNGAPWFGVVANDSINANSLYYTPNGAPFWVMNGVNITPPSGHIKSINGVAWEHIKSYNSVLQSHIKTALGVEG